MIVSDVPSTVNEVIFLNSVVIDELTAGFIKGSRRKKNEAELRRFLASPHVGLLDVTEERSERYAIILMVVTGRHPDTHT
jgi:predicted nucleic acid-binding protein